MKAIRIIFLAALLSSVNLLGLIRLSDLMSQDEQKKTGISQLSAVQRQELERWMNEKFVLKTVHPPAPRITLEQNLQNGAQLVLSDGSIYEIAPTDRSKTTFWLTPVSITMSPSQDLAYPTLLTNTLTGVSVRAKQTQPPRSQPASSPQL